jgi:hypothetical protein
VVVGSLAFRGFLVATFFVGGPLRLRRAAAKAEVEAPARA